MQKNENLEKKEIEIEKLELKEENDEEKKRKIERYIQRLEAHVEATKENVDYSLKRFDILIISLSSGGLGLSIGLVKNLIPNLDDVDTTFLKYSWALFGGALILNLLSQVTSYFANINEMKIVTNLIREKRNKAIKGNQNWLEFIKSTNNFFTNFFNAFSLFAFIAAVIFLIIFISNES